MHPVSVTMPPCSMLALMPTIDDAAILSRAKQLCEAAGMAWDYRDLVAQPRPRISQGCARRRSPAGLPDAGALAINGGEWRSVCFAFVNRAARTPTVGIG